MYPFTGGLNAHLEAQERLYKSKRILVACEESQAVTKAFRKRGFEAYSCDLVDCSGGHPEWHLHGDFRKFIFEREWDLLIAHPPCTFLCNSGVRWLKGNPLRWEQMIEAKEFFYTLWSIGVNHIGKVAIENPIPHKHAMLPKYTQIIQPWQFGHMTTKATCLWLHGLPELKPTNIVYSEMMKLPKAQRSLVHYASPGKERAKIRSKTYSGIAQAMAQQWGDYLIKNLI